MGSKKASKAQAKAGAKKKASSTKKSTKKQEFNPRAHRLVPTHEVLDEAALEELYEKFDIDPTNLPSILATDAALKGLDVKVGDVIKITRPSPTAGEAKYYRRVAYE